MKLIGFDCLLHRNCQEIRFTVQTHELCSTEKAYKFPVFKLLVNKMHVRHQRRVGTMDTEKTDVEFTTNIPPRISPGIKYFSIMSST
jgi:hypothetical protein